MEPNEEAGPAPRRRRAVMLSWILGLALAGGGLWLTAEGERVARTLGNEGALLLETGAREGRYLDAQGRSRDLGFAVALRDLRVTWPPPKVWARLASGGDERPCPLEPGRPFALEGGRELTWLEYFPSYHRETHVQAAPPQESAAHQTVTAVGMALKLKAVMAAPGAQPIEMWLFPGVPGRDRAVTRDGLFAARALSCETAEDYRLWWREQEGSARGGWLYARLLGSGVARRLAVRLGEERAVVGGYRVCFERWVPGVDIAAEAGEAARRNPAAWLRVQGPNGEERRWVFDRPEQVNRGPQAGDAGIRFDYRWPSDREPLRLFLIRDPEGRWEMVQDLGPRPLTRVPLELGRLFRLAESPYAIAVEEILERAYEVGQESSTDPRPLRPVLHLRARTGAAVEEIRLEVGKGPVAIMGDALGLRAEVGAEPEIEAVLEIHQERGAAHTRTLRRGETFWWRGVLLRQATAYDPQAPGRARLEVVRWTAWAWPLAGGVLCLSGLLLLGWRTWRLGGRRAMARAVALLALAAAAWFGAGRIGSLRALGAFSGYPVHSATIRVAHLEIPAYEEELVLRPGQTGLIGDTEYAVRFAGFLPDFTMNVESNEVRSRSTERRNPACLLELYEGPRKLHEQWVLRGDPERHRVRRPLLVFQVVGVE